MMKKIELLTLGLLTIGLIIFSSCNDLEEEDIQTVEESEAVEILEYSLQEDNGSVQTEARSVSNEILISLNGANCNEIMNFEDENDVRFNEIGVSYNIQSTYELICNQFDIPIEAYVSSNSQSSYDSPRMNLNGSSTMTSTITGLQFNQNWIEFELEYSHSGTQIFIFKDNQSVDGTLNVTLMSFQLEKSDLSISSGAGTFNYSGTTGGEIFEYTGSIVFNGNGTATVTINDNIYMIQL